MRSICRLLLISMVAVALPVQGFAAAGMLHCVSPAMPTLAQSHALAQSHSDAHFEEDSAAGGDSHHAHHAGHGDAAASPELQPSHDGHKCSACAACCAGAALPASAIRLALPEPSVEPALPPAKTAVSFIASGLERPPRSHLA